MKVFLFKIIAAGAPLIILMILVNYFGDAGRLFSAKYEQKIIRILLSHHSATNIGNYNERLLQQQWIGQMPVVPNVVVLGSSKTMLIDSDMVRDQRLINSSVSSASLADCEAIWHRYKTLNKIPAKIILGIDPWMFNTDSVHRTQNDGPNKHSQAGYGSSIYSDTLAALFSPTYFQHSLTALIRKIKGEDEPVATRSRYNIFNTKNADGSLSYGQEYHDGDKDIVASRVEIYLKRGDISDLSLLNSVAADKWEQMLRMIKDMKSRHVQVILLLTPFYPKVYQTILKGLPKGLSIEPLLRQLATQQAIELVGSYDPFKCGLAEDCFYDAVHCNEKGITRITKNTGISSIYSGMPK